MAQLPESWGLKTKKRPDGKLDIVGKNALGKEYVARTTEQDGISDEDVKVLEVGNPNKRNADAFVGYFRDQRDNARKQWEHAQDDLYLEGAEKVVHAGMHLRESRLGYSRRYAEKYDSVFGGN